MVEIKNAEMKNAFNGLISRLTDMGNKLMITKGERGRRDKLGVWD